MLRLVGPLRRTFARACLETRIGLDLTQQQLADRAGVTRGYIAKVERGRANPTIDRVLAIADALGLELELTARPPLLTGSPRSGDLVHGWCSAYADRRLRAVAWHTAREAEITHGRSHGWIDILAFDPRSGTLLVIEIKTRLDDVGAVERRLAWYEREAWDIARDLGWHVRRTSAWLLLLASDEIDRSVRANRDVLARSFPVRATGMIASLADAASFSAGDRGLALIDPSSRRRDWLIRSRVDGRRSPARFNDYADAASRLRS